MKSVSIEYCGDCPYRFYEGNELFCELTDILTTEGEIPEWCPLPDAPVIDEMIFNFGDETNLEDI